MGILGYQLLIAGIIIVSSIKGLKILNTVTLIAVIWTATHVFMPWLMILQLGTILVSWVVGLVIGCIVEAIKS